MAGLGRDFLACADRAENEDPLAGRWAAVVRALRRCCPDGQDGGTDRLAMARNGLVRKLDAALARTRYRAGWIRYLHAQTDAACGRLDAVADRDERTAEIEASRPVPSPSSAFRPARTFEGLIGRAHAVTELRRHASDQTAGVDLLLHGPDEVGKRTLARVYARAFLCETPTSGGAACSRCDACRYFDAEARGCIEVDGARRDIDSVTDQTVRLVQSASLLSARHVFVVRNADCYPPAAFDKLLKPMEDIGAVSFVLLARDRASVRLAGQSRCFDYRVRALSRPESEAFLREVLAERGLAWDEARIGLLADACGGLPGRLIDACETVAGIGSASLAAVRAELGLGWAGNLLERWPAIVEGGPAAVAHPWSTSDADCAEWVRRVRAVLQLIALGGAREGRQSSSALDLGLRHLDEQSRAAFAAVVARYAVWDGTTAEAVWAGMVQTWMSDRASSG